MGYRLAAVLAALSVHILAQESMSGVATVSVCELVKNPSQYHARMVQVRAQAYPRMIDTPLTLADSTCYGSILLDVGRQKEGNDEPVYSDLRRYLAELPVVEATFVGRFEMVLVPSGEPLLRLRLLRVKDLTPGKSSLPVRSKRSGNAAPGQ